MDFESVPQRKNYEKSRKKIDCSQRWQPQHFIYYTYKYPTIDISDEIGTNPIEGAQQADD